MKKFFTLLLVLAGCVSTVSAKTIYFIDNWGRTNLQLYAWTGENNSGWISLSTVPISYIGCSDGYKWCYELNLGSYENFLISHNEYDGRTQTPNLSTSNYTEGKYYEYYYDGSDKSEKLQEATLYTYSFNITTATSWENFYIYLWDTATNGSIGGEGNGWPGKELTGTGNVYSYTFRSYINTVGVIFNQGNEQPQTCDLRPEEGTNNYYISTIVSGGNNGEIVKTNSSGYATYVNSNSLTMTNDIAYVAEDKGSWAQAHNITSAPANTAMLIHGAGSTTYHFAKGDASALPCTNAFHAGNGSTLASFTEGYNYILNGDTFKAANGQTVGTKKAYLQLSAQAPAEARVLIFDNEDVTAIENIKQDVKVNGEYFNLAGQRVAQPTKGLYIVNGKKVIIK